MQFHLMVVCLIKKKKQPNISQLNCAFSQSARATTLFFSHTLSNLMGIYTGGRERLHRYMYCNRNLLHMLKSDGG